MLNRSGLFFILLSLMITRIFAVDYSISQPLISQADVSLIEKKYTNINIVYMPPAAEYKYYRTIGKGIELGAKTTINNYKIRTPLIDDPNKQYDLLKRVLDGREVDVIIISTHNPVLISPLLERAVTMGIVVIIVNSDIPDFNTKVHAVVGYNQRTATERPAKYLIDQYKTENLKIGILEGSPGYHSTERVEGFLNGIRGIDNFRILTRENAKWNVEGGFNATLTMLKDYPSINTIFATNDYEILGSISAAKLLGRKDITFWGNDGDSSALDMVRKGVLDGTVNTYPELMGRISVKVAMDILQHKTSGGFVEIPTTLEVKQTSINTSEKELPREIELITEKPAGFILDILEEIYTPYSIKLTTTTSPFVRGLAKLKSGDGDIILTGGFPGVVEDVYFPLWHYGVDSVTALYNPNVMDIFDEKELKNLKIGVIRSYNLDRYLYSDVNILELNNRDNALHMLEHNRIDVYIDIKSEIEELLDSHNINLGVSKFTQTDFIQIRNYLSFKDSDIGRELAWIFDEEFPKLIYNGKLREIYKKWNRNYPF